MKLFIFHLLSGWKDVVKVVILLTICMSKYMIQIKKHYHKSISVQHESCKCKCRLNGNTYNSKQKWHHDKYQCKSEISINWSPSEKGYIWNPWSDCTSDCKCDKMHRIGEYLDISNFACEKCVIRQIGVTMWRY